MASMIIPLQLGAAAMTVMGQVRAGAHSNAMAKANAARQRQLAGQERAAGQRRAMAVRRKADVARSNALARIAAGGGGGDSGTENLMARIDGEGEFAALNALGQGEAAADQREFDAAMKRTRGKAQRGTAYWGALTDGLSYASKFAEKPAIQDFFR